VNDLNEIREIIDKLKSLLQEGKIDPETLLAEIGEAESEVREINLEEIAAEESEAQSYFFGEEIRFAAEDFEPYSEEIRRCMPFGLEPHILLPRSFTPQSQYPGWRVRMEKWIYTRIESEEMLPEAINLSPYFDTAALVLVDTRMKPNYQNGRQMYRDDSDFLGKIIGQMRENGVIPRRGYIEKGSRYAISWTEIHRFILPELAKLLGLKRDQIRLPRLVEFCFLSDCFYPQWYQGNTWEWFEDNVRFGSREEKLFGGKFSFATMSTSVYTNWPEARSDRIGFRPLILLGKLDRWKLG